MAKTGVDGPGSIDSGNGDQTPESRNTPINPDLLEKAQQEREDQEQDEQQEEQQPSEQQQILDLTNQIARLEAQLAQAERTIIQTQRRAEIERELIAARAVDLETATLLTEAAIAEMDQPDVAIAVRELSGRKPFLFAAPPAAGAAGLSMSPAPAQDKHHAVNSIAQRARVSGDRAELLRYLRARRTT